MAIKTIAVINTQADSFIPDNTGRLVSPQDVRDRVKDLADSSINRLDDKLLLNLRNYVTSRPYEIGEYAFESGVLYECINNTQGAFNAPDWSAASVGGTSFTGLTDTPASYAGQGLKGVRVNTGATALEFYTITGGTAIITDRIAKGTGTDIQDSEFENVAGSFAPAIGGAFNLGNITRQWSQLYFTAGGTGKIIYGNTFQFDNGSVRAQLNASGWLTVGSAVALAKMYVDDGELRVKGPSGGLSLNILDNSSLPLLKVDEATGNTTIGNTLTLNKFTVDGNISVGSTAATTIRAFIKGAGNTDATTALAVQNSDGENLIRAFDGNTIGLNYGTAPTGIIDVQLHNDQGGNTSFYAATNSTNTTTTRVGILLGTGGIAAQSSIALHGPTYTGNLQDSLAITANTGITGGINLSIADTGAQIKFSATSTAVTRAYMAYDGSFVFGAPTGGAKGAGTINAQAVYDDNVLLTDFVFDKYYGGNVSDEDIKKTPRLSNFDIMTLEECEAFVKENRHLPTIIGRKDWERQGSSSVGQLVSQLWETVETQFLYIAELKNKIK